MVPFGIDVELPGFAFLMEKKLQGSTMGSNRFRVDIPHWLELYQQGRLKFDELVSRRIRLEEINDGFETMKGDEVARRGIVFYALPLTHPTGGCDTASGAPPCAAWCDRNTRV